MKNIREEVAKLAHDIWSDWMHYMWQNYDEKNEEKWVRQASTSYYDLSEKEKESDRKIADRYIKLITHERKL